MDGELVGPRLHHGARAAFIGSTASTHFSFTHHATFGIKCAFTGDAVVNHIHHATNSASAIKQSSWTTQNFNAFSGEWVDRYRMVKAQTGDIHIRTAVLQYANAVTVHAAYGRSPHIGAERAVSDTR